MPREHGRILCAIWTDPDWRARSPGAQRLYFLLISQRTITTCGVLPLQVSKWARGSNDTTAADVETALAELSEHRYVVVDRDTEEVLVRTFIRNDGVAKHPNMLKNALRVARQTESPLLRAALALELRRLGRIIATEVADEIDPNASRTHPEPIANPSRPSASPSGTRPEPVAHRSATHPESIASPSGTHPEQFANPSRTESEPIAVPWGEGVGEGVVSRSVAGDLKDLPPSAARSSGGDAAQALVGEWLDRCAKRPPARVIGHISGQVKALLGEGVDPDDIRRGLAAWTAKGLHPSTLPSVINEVMNRAPPRAGPATTDRRTAAVQALKVQFRAHATNQRQLPAGGDP